MKIALGVSYSIFSLEFKFNLGEIFQHKKENKHGYCENKSWNLFLPKVQQACAKNKRLTPFSLSTDNQNTL